MNEPICTSCKASRIRFERYMNKRYDLPAIKNKFHIEILIILLHIEIKIATRDYSKSINLHIGNKLRFISMVSGTIHNCFMVLFDCCNVCNIAIDILIERMIKHCWRKFKRLCYLCAFVRGSGQPVTKYSIFRYGVTFTPLKRQQQ